jgi:hypothetical protein
MTAVEAMLRQPARVIGQLGEAPLTIKLLGVALAGALVYGFVVGTFSGGDQFWAAPVKVAGGLILSALICLPSLYIFACLSGVRAGMGQVGGLIAGLVALMTVLLLGFAPVAWVFSQSTESVALMGTLHLLFWAIATGFALRFMERGFDQFHASSGGSLRAWTFIFVLVMLQMSTALRPLVGTSPTFLPGEKRFFISHWLQQMKIDMDEPYSKRVSSDHQTR